MAATEAGRALPAYAPDKDRVRTRAPARPPDSPFPWPIHPAAQTLEQP